MNYQFKFWHYGLVITAILSLLLGYNLWQGDKRLFISGPPTHGHHQIELACDSCHGGPFADRAVMQTACESCHLEELNKFSDSHPQAKFTDPRNAELLSHLDATQCVTCHREHKPEITRDYGVTLAKDFCAHCHQDIAQERPSHTEFGFETCTNSGCHNYHDNTALYENFLRKHTKDPWLLKRSKWPERSGLAQWLKKNKNTPPLTPAQHDGQTLNLDEREDIVALWADSHHAVAQVNCSDCHQNDEGKTRTGLDLNLNSCGQCHEKQTERFTQGKHGMRLAKTLGETLTPMSPAMAIRPMHSDVHSAELNCSSCHQPHKTDLTFAAVDACLGCHNDDHSNNFLSSSHGQLWTQFVAGDKNEKEAVSCATCHMPRIKKGRNVVVEHNQSATLQPNSKMLRSVCGNCHGVEFSMAALADKALIDANFSEKPEPHHTSMDLVRDRIEQRRKMREAKE
ncbi:ammonia-forming cytochrome c nitrite reductase subunit c552 [Simiduia agarivorans]|uniref:nitrite reductase (cytochrome; ammonia-forming) n=1 Tax=Simiduia agarivorans (strain DSM 21679 / JCM 13881 / BCRC 17597 / SA1) TaxID=1117647 RepID=K4KJV0_SIMAS|nr:ammonia-forming cytochrome c nitrite reductase subunit c552 [Simiduia agarivorans]AFU98505.1 hypothetical protein M5M_06550 [Simiduia agarivorans SA1 = DSM 21679]